MATFKYTFNANNEKTRKQQERKRKAEERRIAAEKNAGKRKKALAIILPAAGLVLAFVVLLFTVILPGAKYKEAQSAFNAGRYDEAIAAFSALGGYRDSKAFLEQCYIGKYGAEQYNRIKDTEVGEICKFGTYEQDNDLTNGKEEIEWIVLDKKGVSLLLISKYALDCRQYHTSMSDVTWESCSLREWLNGPFLDTFQEEERNYMIAATVTADQNPSFPTAPGKDVTDQIFLLSIAEVNKYYPSDEARKCVPTDYAKAQGVWKSKIDSIDGRATCCWWLRSPGSLSDHAALVLGSGAVETDGRGVFNILGGIRPALWIDFGA